MKFRKKPVEVEAWQNIAGNPTPSWRSRCSGDISGTLLIPTLEGMMRADPGDWIIKGVKGEVYPCKPDIFEMTYEPIVEAHEETQS